MEVTMKEKHRTKKIQRYRKMSVSYTHLRDKERDREGTPRPRLWPLPECFPDGRGTDRLTGQLSHCKMCIRDRIDISMGNLRNNFEEGMSSYNLTFINTIIKYYEKVFPDYVYTSRESIIKSEK